MAAPADRKLSVNAISPLPVGDATTDLRLVHLPLFALYIRDNRFEELVELQFRLAREMELPLLRQFGQLSQDQLREISRAGLMRMLEALITNQTTGYFESAVDAWLNDQRPLIARNLVISDDLVIASFIRRTAFRTFLPDYTSDTDQSFALLSEIDRFVSEFDRLLFKTLLKIQIDFHEQAQGVARIGNWQWDLATDSLFWSKELFHIYELEPQDLVTHNIASFNHPDDADMVRNRMELSRQTRQPHDFYYRIRLPSGKEKYLHAIGKVLTNEKGETERMVGTLQDVSREKYIERAHEETELFVRKIADLTPSMIAVYSVLTGKYFYVNKAINALLGYSAAEAMKEGAAFFRRIIHPDDVSRIQLENEHVLKELEGQFRPNPANEIREFRYRLRHNDGSYRWMQTFGAVFERDAAGQIEKLINITNDITDRVDTATLILEQSNQIALQEERYAKMVEEVEDYAILLLSSEGIIQNWNLGAQKIKGYLASEIVGKHLRTFYTPEDRESQLPEKLIEHARTHGKSTHEGWRVRKDGSRFWANAVLTALHDEEGKVIGFTKVTRDLTAKKASDDLLRSYNEQLRQKNLLLETKNKELESFTYIASHDLQEPVRKILLWANRVSTFDGMPENTRSAVAKIEKAGVRMQSLIRGLLNYAHVDKKKEEMQIADLNGILSEVLEEYAEQFETIGASVSCSALPTLPLLKTQMSQLFANLVSNALKYARPDTPLRLRIESAPREDETEGLLHHEIRFSDNGIGFDQEYAERVFEIFQRLDTSRSPGTGIGLAICRKIVQNHRGSIRAESSVGNGTTFIICLPG